MTLIMYSKIYGKCFGINVFNAHSDHDFCAAKCAIELLNLLQLYDHKIDLHIRVELMSSAHNAVKIKVLWQCV